MNPVLTTRRRAQQFDALVEGSVDPRGGLDAELLELVSALRSVEPAQPRPAFTAELRERLLLAAQTELVAPVETASSEVQRRLTVQSRRSPRERRLVAAVGGLAIVGATGSMAMASQSALPGDTLYPLKRAIENAHAGLSVGDEAKGTTLLSNASGRLDEVDQLVAEDPVDSSSVSTTLDDFALQSRQAAEHIFTDYSTHGDTAGVTDLRTFTARSLEVLDRIADRLPPQAQAALVDAGTVLAQIDQEAAQVCPTCGGPEIGQVPSWLLEPTGLTTMLGGTPDGVVGLDEVGSSAPHRSRAHRDRSGVTLPRVPRTSTTTAPTAPQPSGSGLPDVTASQGQPVKQGDLGDAASSLGDTVKKATDGVKSGAQSAGSDAGKTVKKVVKKVVKDLGDGLGGIAGDQPTP